MNAPRFIPAPRLARIDAPARPRRAAAVLTAAAAIGALVLATALPARASDKDDLLKGIIAALVIGAIVKESKKHKTPAPAPIPVNKVIPRSCAIQIDGKKRIVTVYPERCLKAEGVTAPLPTYCAQEARIYGEWDRIYGTKCLADAGFTLTSVKMY